MTSSNAVEIKSNHMRNTCNQYLISYEDQIFPIEWFHSTPQIQTSKGMVTILLYLTKDDQNSFVKEHQPSACDVMWNRTVQEWKDQYVNESEQRIDIPVLLHLYNPRSMLLWGRRLEMSHIFCFRFL